MSRKHKIIEVSDSESDTPELSTETLKALQEFYDHQTEKYEKMESALEKTDGEELLNFEEDWQLSQFWYDDRTSEVLAKEALRIAGPTGRIALISCPTLYTQLRKESRSCQVTLFEYDRRFAAHGSDFVFYDYKSPLDVPHDLAAGYDLVIADPPFLSEECLTKTAVTVRFLARDKIVLCTGATMQDLATKLLGLRKADFQPRHRNNLANEFYCYANYDMNEFIK